jgi:hypothetical protein
MPQKDSAEKAVRDIHRKTRRKFSAEEKIRRFNGPRSPGGIQTAFTPFQPTQAVSSRHQIGFEYLVTT